MATNDPMSGGRLRRAADSGVRRSGARAVIFWLVAIVAGLGAALLITRHLDRRTVTVSTPTAQIVVAAVDLPLATKLRVDHLKLTDWPIGGLPPGALRETKDAVDRIITSRILEGEPISSQKLAAKDAGNGLAALIPANMRAIAVRVDDVVGVAGFIHPDDRVDVIVTIRPMRPAESEPTSKVILQNVKVLAVGKEIDVSDKKRNEANPVTVATLLVNPEESEKLALAASEGKILLTLRSWTDNQSVATEGIYPSGLLADTNTKPREIVQAIAPPPPPPPERERRPSRSREREDKAESVTAAAPRRRDVVEILRGDRFEERKFEAKEKN